MGAKDMKRVLWGSALLPLSLSVIALAVLLFSPPGVPTAKADNLYARIQGTVTDPSGAALVGVKLTATNVGTNISYQSESKAEGNFVFLNLPVGTYKVVATSSGFRTSTATGITLVLDQVYALNIKMELGQISEQVLVEASNVQVETSNTQLGTVIGGDTIRDMPLINRNWINLQQLEPGVVASSDRFGSNFSTNGSQSQQNSYLIMGQDSNDLPLNTPLIIPNPDAIGEFNLVTNTINPEYGRNSGAVLNAAIRSGTNAFHGDAFDFYRDTFLNDKDFFTKTAAVFHQNQFGGTVGGPIYKNHTFFFFSYQGTRARQAQPFNVPTVFSAAERTGDFGVGAFDGTPGANCPQVAGGPKCVPAVNPNTSPTAMFGDANSTCPVSGGVMCAPGTPFGTTFGGANQTTVLTNGLFSTGAVPSQDLNSIATNLTNTYVPLPNSSGNQFAFSPVTTLTADQYIWRVDHTFSTKDTITSYGYMQRNPTNDTLPFTGATVPGFGEHATRFYKQYTAGWTHTFNSNVLNELRLGYTRFNFDAVEPNNPTLPSSVGFAINPQNTKGAGLPVISLTGLFTLGFSANGPQPRIDQTYQIDDNFSFALGKHTFKFGINARRFKVSNPFFFNNSGAFNFGGSGPFSTGLPGADFLLGIPDSYAQSNGGFIDASAQAFYTYAQDSWKATQSLTINYGLGWQINLPLTDHFNHDRAINCFRAGQQSVIFPTAPTGLVFPGDAGCTASGYKTGFTHFGPRLGLAWAPHASGALGHLTGDQGKFSIRAGVGVYFNQVEEELTLQNLTAPPFAITSLGASDAPLFGNPSFATPFVDITGAGAITNKFPFTPPAAGSNVDFSFFEPFSLNLLDPNFSVPYAINQNVTVQRELPGQIVLSVGYVGSFGRHLERAFDLNPGINPAACAADPVCVRNRVFQGFVAPQNFKYDPTVFGGLGQQSTDGNSHYSSLQVLLQKRISHGLTAGIAYTWSHGLDDGSSFENTSFGVRGTNRAIPRLNFGDSGFDARHRFVANYTYELPVLQAMKGGWKSRLFQGWRIAGNTTLQTGFPINVSNSDFTSLTCYAFFFYGCPDNAQQVVSSIQKFDPRQLQTLTNGRGQKIKGNFYFAPADFCGPRADPTCPLKYGQFSDNRRNSFHGPGINATNLAILKDIHVTEQQYFELRLETQNTFNHVSFNNPSSSGQNVNSSQFGRITSDSNIGPRLIQLGAKFYF